MEGITESSGQIEEMLAVEKNAGKVLEEAKEKANQKILQARSEARNLLDKTREDLLKEREALEARLRTEGEEEVARVTAQRGDAIQRIKEKAHQQHDHALADLRELLFGDLRW